MEALRSTAGCQVWGGGGGAGGLPLATGEEINSIISIICRSSPWSRGPGSRGSGAGPWSGDQKYHCCNRFHRRRRCSQQHASRGNWLGLGVGSLSFVGGWEKNNGLSASATGGRGVVGQGHSVCHQPPTAGGQVWTHVRIKWRERARQAHGKGAGMNAKGRARMNVGLKAVAPRCRPAEATCSARCCSWTAAAPPRWQHLWS